MFPSSESSSYTLAASRTKGHVVIYLLLLIFSYGCLGSHKEDNQETESEKLTKELAVVDYKVLVQAHPDYPKLKQLDDQIRLIRQQIAIIPMAEERKTFEKSRGEMKSAVAKAKKELEAEKSKVEAQLAALSREINRQLQNEINRLSAQTKAKIQKEIQPLMASSQQFQGTPDQAMKEFMENLSLVRARNRAARRLELEKSLRQELDAVRQQLDSELSTYEDQITAKFQQEKLNLQLKLQVSQDEEEQKKLQDRLTAIAREINELKAEKARELDKRYEKIRSQKTQEMQSKLREYEKQLDLEVQKKLAAKQNQLIAAGKIVPSGPPPEIKAQIKKIEREAQAQFNRRKAELTAKLRKEQSKAIAKLKQKQAEIEKRLRKLSREIGQRLERTTRSLSKHSQEKIDKLTARLNELTQERQKIYDLIISDLKAKVAQVAKRKNNPMVIGAFIINRNLVDLTDLSLVAVKQIDR